MAGTDALSPASTYMPATLSIASARRISLFATAM